MEKILEVKNLETIFYTEGGIIPAVDKVSFSVPAGKTLGIVGESGCGKSVTALSMMKLIPTPPGKIKGGEILFEGKDLVKFSHEEMQNIRGREISMIFQEPMTSLNPVFTVGNQLSEVFQVHYQCNPKEALERSVEALHLVGIPAPEERVKDYPHALSGGMRQRVMIAMALGCRPKVLICDEPTTALDVTIQAQILELMQKLQEEIGMSMVFISHDLGVIAGLCDEVMIMYAGRVVEKAPTAEIFKSPQHPYTEALLKSIPRLGQGGEKKLYTIPGIVPELRNLPKGCYYADRCNYATDQCRTQQPELKQGAGDRAVSCFHPVGAV